MRGGGWAPDKNYHYLVATNFLRRVSRPPPGWVSPPQTRREDEDDEEDPAQRLLSRASTTGTKVSWTLGPNHSLEKEEVQQLQQLQQEEYDESDSPVSFLARSMPSGSSQNTSRARRDGSTSLPEIQVGKLRAAASASSGRGDAECVIDMKQDKATFLPSTPSKMSLMQRFSRMISNDDLVEKRNQTESCSSMDGGVMESPSSSQFSFLKRIRTTISRGERHAFVLESEQTSPLAVIAYLSPLPVSGHSSKHRKEHFRSDRLRHLVAGSNELKALDFRENEEVTYGKLLRLRKPQRRRSSLGEKKTRKRSIERLDSSIYFAIDELRSRGGSAEPNNETTLPADIDDVLGDEDYDPELIGEIDAVAKTTYKYPAYISTIYTFTDHAELKKRQNEKFRQKFPNVQLTFSKLKSLKRELFELSMTCGVDSCTLSHAFIFFERIVLKGGISKSNRKLVVGACFILAIKLCDSAQMKIREVAEVVAARFRVNRREMLSFELPVCLSLCFHLILPRDHIQTHYNKMLFHGM